jgi:hypothetical protein
MGIAGNELSECDGECARMVGADTKDTTGNVDSRPGYDTNHVTEARIGTTERAIERKQVEVSCECRLSHGYDIISLGHSGMVYDTYL